jgi:Flp pilus assembly protein CpaB
MKPKTMVLMVIAVVCGLGASYMTSQLLADRAGPPEKPKVAVFVAKKQIEIGTPLKNAKDLFEVKMVTEGDEPKTAVKDLDNIKDKYAKAIRKGQYFMLEDVTDEQSQLQVPEGFRAVGVRVNTEAIAGGFAALPGSRVDLIYHVRRGGDDETHSGILLEDVLVLGADAIHKRDDAVSAITASVVTLALKPKEMLTVDLAMASGTLRLVLRKFGDKSLADTTKVTTNQMLHGKGDEKDGKKGEFSEKVVSALAAPAVPVAPNPIESKPVVERPKYRKHMVTVHDASGLRRIAVLVDERGEPVLEDVTKANEDEGVDLPPPPKAQDRPLTPPTPAAPAPQVGQTPAPVTPAAVAGKKF